MAEKGRLTYEHMAYSIHVYKRSRQTLRESLSQLASAGVKRIVLYGTGEPAELAYLTLKEFGLEPVGVFAREANGHFLGFPVRAIGRSAARSSTASSWRPLTIRSSTPRSSRGSTCRARRSSRSASSRRRRPAVGSE